MLQSKAWKTWENRVTSSRGKEKQLNSTSSSSVTCTFRLQNITAFLSTASKDLIFDEWDYKIFLCSLDFTSKGQHTFSAASRSWLRRWRQPMSKQILEFGSWIDRKILSASDKSSLSTQVTASSHCRRVFRKDIVAGQEYTELQTKFRKLFLFVPRRSGSVMMTVSLLVHLFCATTRCWGPVAI